MDVCYDGHRGPRREYIHNRGSIPEGAVDAFGFKREWWDYERAVYVEHGDLGGDGIKCGVDRERISNKITTQQAGANPAKKGFKMANVNDRVVFVPKTGGMPLPKGQTGFAAIVCGMPSATTVNLAVFDDKGNLSQHEGVQVIASGAVPPKGGGYVVD